MYANICNSIVLKNTWRAMTSNDATHGEMAQSKSSYLFVTLHWRGTYLTYFHDEQLDLPSVSCCWGRSGEMWRGRAGASGGGVTFCRRKEDRHGEQRNTDGERVKWCRCETPLPSKQQEKALAPYSQACQIILRSLQKNREINSQTPINEAVMYPHFSFM